MEEQEDENDESEGTTVKRQKRKERLTTAEKNKRRRKNQEKFERQVELRKQSVNKGIDKYEAGLFVLLAKLQCAWDSHRKLRRVRTAGWRRSRRRLRQLKSDAPGNGRSSS